MPDDRLGSRDESVTYDTVPFVWVQDDTTGHRYDVPQTALRNGMSPVDDVELNFTGRARPPKYRIDKGGDPAEPTRVDIASGDQAVADAVAAQNTPPEAPNNDTSSSASLMVAKRAAGK